MIGKDSKDLEIIIKGIANHRRIQILYLLGGKNKLPTNDGLSVNDIAETLRIGFRSASQHLDKMYRGGLVAKTPKGPAVIHSLTGRGVDTLNFLGRFGRR